MNNGKKALSLSDRTYSITSNIRFGQNIFFIERLGNSFQNLSLLATREEVSKSSIVLVLNIDKSH